MKRPQTAAQRRLSASISGGMALVFVLVGLFQIIPIFGMFGIIWTVVALVICISNLRQFVGKGGRSGKDRRTVRTVRKAERRTGPVHIQAPAAQPVPTVRYGIQYDRQKQLDQLVRLRDAGLLTNEEYRDKRDEIMGQR